MAGGRSGNLLDVADEAKPALVQGANQGLVIAAVPERAAGRADAGAERGLRDDAALPDRLDQLVLAYDALAILHEVNDQVEHLRLDMDDRAGTPQLVPSDIDLEVGKTEIQEYPHAKAP